MEVTDSTVRRATAADAEAVARVQERSWQQAYRHVFPVEELDRGGFIQPERWRQRLREPPRGWTTLVGERGGDVAGFVCVGASRDERACGEVYAIYIEPEAWGTGLGAALLARGEEELAGRHRQATLWVLDDNPRARRFYERSGWAPDGARKREVWWGVEAAEVRYRKRLAAPLRA